MLPLVKTNSRNDMAAKAEYLSTLQSSLFDFSLLLGIRAR